MAPKSPIIFMEVAAKGNPEVIKHLNIILKNELTAINQYFSHARMLRDWGFEALGEKVYQESLGEMHHADYIINRVLMLGAAQFAGSRLFENRAKCAGNVRGGFVG